MSDTVDKNYIGTLILTCENCGGHMEVEKETDVVRCPYCGVSGLLVESDEVVIERIRSKAFKDVAREQIQADKELELEKLQQLKQEQIETKLIKIQKNPITVIIAIFTVISLFATVICFRISFLASAIFAGIQTLLFLITWLMRMRIIKGSRIHLHSLASMFGILLIIPFLMFIGVEHVSYDKYIWPDNELTAMIPKPQSVYGEIREDDAENFEIRIGSTKEKNYNAYIEECIEKGFSSKSARSQSTYTAFNEDGDELHISYYSRLKEMDVSITANKEYYEIIWSDRGVAALLPEPVSKLGTIKNETEDRFSAIIAKTSISDYNKYVNACIDAGFTENMLIYEKNFYAQNGDGIKIEIEHNVNDVMKILVYVPNDLE